MSSSRNHQNITASLRHCHLCACLLVYNCLYMHTQIHTHLHTHLHTNAHTYTHTYTHLYTPTHTYTRLHILTYITCTHSHTSIYIYISSFIRQADKPQHVTQWQ